MAGESPGRSEHVAVAVEAGEKAEGEAIKDRLAALKRAMKREDEEEVLTIAKEVLGLIKVDEHARDAVDIEKVEAALDALTKEPPRTPRAETKEEEPAPAPPKEPAKKEPELSVKAIPEIEHSKTELEREAKPFWKRTERYWEKVGIVALVYVVLFAGYWLFVRTPPDAMLEKCKKGDKAECWRAVALEDAQDGGHNIAPEPLELLCNVHQDPCACAGLAYVNSDCGGLASASSLDPKWACQCKRYDFWHWGQERMPHCPVPRCETPAVNQ